jgi:hypothetical protein
MMGRPRGKAPGRVLPVAEKLLPAGRPRKDPPADAARRIREATARGCNRRGVAMALGCNVDVLVRWLDERAELKEAFDEGREKERAALHGKLYEAAMSGAVVPALFLLKARHGYREGEQEGQANRVSVVFRIPGALPLDKYNVEVIDDTGTEQISDETARRP